MSTTTIRLPEALKSRVAKAAELSGLSTHAFILEAISEHVTDRERREGFYQSAEARFAQIAEGGKTVGWDDMKRYLVERKSNKGAVKPGARKILR